MLDEVFRGESPQADAKRPSMYDVISPAKGESWECCSLDSMILGLPCHWREDKQTGFVGSRYCRKDLGRCEGCVNQWREIWQGFLPVYNYSLRKAHVLRLGRESALQLAKRRIPTQGLCGVKFKVRKPVNSPTCALIFEDPEAKFSHGCDFRIDIVPSLCLVLGTIEIPDTYYTAKELLEREGVQ